MRTTWANLLNDALYNSLTQALFVDKYLTSAENTLALINAEQISYGIPDSLADCACVASDFLKARKSALLKKLSPLVAESGLPAVYANLRKGLSSYMLSSANVLKTQKGGAPALVKKFADQFANLARAKTSARYITWLKTAEQLEDMSKGTRNESVFSAIRDIAALVLELFRTGEGENLLRDPEYLFKTKLFKDPPSAQTHPAVRALWEFFCCAGERKYGAEWGEAARVAQLSFVAEESQSALKKQYQILMNSSLDDLDFLVLKIMRGTSTWTEQELYVLNTVFTTNLENFDKIDSSFEMQFLNAFNLLTRIGRKWRPEAPWHANVQKSFDDILRDFRLGLITSVITDIPYDAISSYALIMLSLVDAGHLRAIEKTASNRLPLQLSDSELENLEEYAIDKPLPRWTMKVLETLVGRRKGALVLSFIAYVIVKESAKDAFFGKIPSQQAWMEFSRKELPKELADALPQDNLMGCFCRLCSGMPHGRITNEPQEIKSFLAALPAVTVNNCFADFFLIILLTWQDVAPDLLVQLFGKTYLFHNRYNNDSLQIGNAIINISDLADMVERMLNEANRQIVALGMLTLLIRSGKKKGGAALKEAIKTLESLANVKAADLNSGKKHKIVNNTNNQELLPFDD